MPVIRISHNQIFTRKPKTFKIEKTQEVKLDLETWMLKNGMEVGEMARILGVTRQVIWKIKNGKTVDPETAQKVYFITGGCVNPVSKPRGFPLGQKKNRKKKSTIST